MSSPSDAPVRAPGSHTRSGNAMLRTRTAILAAAADCVARNGVRRTTMSEVSSSGGIAKATLYNHFRTKSDLLEGLLLARIDELGDRAAGAGDLAAALRLVAAELAASPALRHVAAEEPEVVAVIAQPGVGRVWDCARSSVAQVLAGTGGRTDAAAVDLVLRWLVTQAVAPADEAQAATAAQLLAGGLRAGGAAPVLSGLGWPGS